MRTFINGAGADVSAAARAYIKANPGSYLLADLIQIKTAIQGAPWSKNFLYTTFDRPLTWSHVGTFVPANVSRSNIDSRIGLTTADAGDLVLNWNLTDSDIMLGAVTILQSMKLGLWDNAVVRLWRVLMPTMGDCNTYGACEMFTGRVTDLPTTRVGVDMKVNSLIELLDQDWPPNLIEADDPQAQYGTGQPPAGLGSVPTFAVVAGSTPSVLLLDCTGPSAGQIFSAETFDFGYIQFTSGNNDAIYRTVRRSDSTAGHNRFYLYEPLPFPLTVGDTLQGLVPFARASTKSVTEAHTIPATPPYTIAVSLAGSGVITADGGVKYSSGDPLAKVSALLSTGQYTTDNNGNYVFFSGDATRNVNITVIKINSGVQGFPFVPQPEAQM